jgi:hypothetical protein
MQWFDPAIGDAFRSKPVFRSKRCQRERGICWRADEWRQISSE